MRGAAALASACLALAAPTADAATPFRPLPAPAELSCPNALAGFTLDRRAGGACAYRSGDQATATLTAGLSEANDREGAVVARMDDLPGWSGTALHLGEADDRDGRREIWTTQPEDVSLSVDLRYAIPGFSPQAARAFVAAAGAANGVEAEAVAKDAGEPCAPSLAGFMLEREVSSVQGGAGLQSACIYLLGQISATLYRAPDAETALEDFDASLGAVEPAEGPSAGARQRVVLADDLYRGLWLAGSSEDEPVVVVEADWLGPDDIEAVQAFLDAAF